MPSNTQEITRKHFCHRNLFADWFELYFGIYIPEIIIDKGVITKIERPDYKPLLLELM